MKSTEKVWEVLERLQDSEDDELEDAIPIGMPPAIIRSGLAMVGSQVPKDPAELDEFLTGVGDFCHSLRSDAA
ncbi:MAG TPA: hypothetical protein VG325_14475 [Solirubrobacteraceae bacterium]|jgi:hypothetical protein|nr:hypothetical protein [Solirubrobacteraceae bacterium]